MQPLAPPPHSASACPGPGTDLDTTPPTPLHPTGPRSPPPGAPAQVALNGDADGGYPGCLNLSFAYVEGESLLMALKNIAVSSGSACTSAR